jgi:hypothetical protein
LHNQKPRRCRFIRVWGAFGKCTYLLPPGHAEFAETEAQAIDFKEINPSLRARTIEH